MDTVSKTLQMYLKNHKNVFLCKKYQTNKKNGGGNAFYIFPKYHHTH